MFSLLVAVGIVLLALSGLFDLIPWQFNVPAIIALLVVWAVAIYNRLVHFRLRTTEAWADIEVQLKRRYDLIPNLVEAVKGYAGHEREAFERVTQARSAAMGAKTPMDHAAAENVLTGALKSIFALAEAYPQLRAVESFTQLQGELTDTEDKVQAARRFYNSTVREYNTLIATVPANLFAALFRFSSVEFFELEGGEEAAAQQPVKVSF